jgi:catechol 2,3-dioxygenase-like lactoylglutathione lyase family enzyme
MKPAAVLESALYVTDLAAAEAFYGDVLGLERIAKVEGRHVFFRCGQGVVLVPPHGTTGQGHLCFAASADEIDAWKSRLEAAGIAIEADFEWPQGGRSIYIRDPSGNSLEFAEPRIWGL